MRQPRLAQSSASSVECRAPAAAARWLLTLLAAASVGAARGLELGYLGPAAELQLGADLAGRLAAASAESRLRVCNAHPERTVAVGYTRTTTPGRAPTLLAGEPRAASPAAPAVQVVATVNASGRGVEPQPTQWLADVPRESCRELSRPWAAGDYVNLDVEGGPKTGIFLPEDPVGTGGVILLVVTSADVGGSEVKLAIYKSQPQDAQVAAVDAEPGSSRAAKLRLVHIADGHEKIAELKFDAVTVVQPRSYRLELVGPKGVEASRDFQAVPGEVYGAVRLAPERLLLFPEGSGGARLPYGRAAGPPWAAAALTAAAALAAAILPA